jgi:HK97 family phage portal protein
MVSEEKGRSGRIGNTFPSALYHEKGRQRLVRSYDVGNPIWKDWSTRTANREGLKSSAWVYSSVRKLATAAASIPWLVERRVGDKWVPVDDHPIEILLRQPNEFMTGVDLFERATMHLNLGGNAIWHLVIARGMPVEIWPLQPDFITPIPGSRKFIRSYRYEIESMDPVTISQQEILHFKFTDPSNPMWGLSPLQAVARVVDTDVEAVRWNKLSLESRAVPDGVFMVNDPHATPQNWEEARRQVQSRYLDKGREPWVLFNVDYKQMSLTPVEMDFLDSRKFTREEIASVFGVLPILIGAIEGTTYNNIQTAKRIFWEDTIIPYLNGVRGVLNLNLLPFFDPTANDSRTPNRFRIVYDTSNTSALQDNLAKKIKNAKLLFDMGIHMREINQRLELGFQDDEIPDSAIRTIESVNAAGEVDPLASESTEKALSFSQERAIATQYIHKTLGVFLSEIYAKAGVNKENRASEVRKGRDSLVGLVVGAKNALEAAWGRTSYFDAEGVGDKFTEALAQYLEAGKLLDLHEVSEKLSNLVIEGVLESHA